MRAYICAVCQRHVVLSRLSERPRRRSLSGAALGSVVLLLLCLYARPSAVMAGTPRPLPDASDGATADVVSHSLRFSRAHGFLMLSGEARNVSRHELPQLEVVVELFDDSGRLVNVECGLVKIGAIASGDEAPFEVQSRDDRAVASYRIRFRRLTGAPVPSAIKA